MEKRIKRIQNFLKEDESAIVLSDSNRLYLTGFRSSAGIVLITRKSAFLIIDFRYFEKAKSVITALETRLLTDTKTQLSDIFQSEKIKKVHLETDFVDIARYQKFCSDFENLEISLESGFSNLLNRLRMVKDGNEIEFIKSAQNITDKAFSYILGRIEAGRCEKDIALDLEFFMRKNGAENVAFDTIAVSGKNSSLPHGVPTDKPLEKGDFLTMDFGAKYRGYCSDMTRTVAIGQISDKQRKVYETVLNAQELALSEISPSRVCKEIDAVSRNYINENGFEGCFGHGLGHSVGIDIHESPSFNTRDMTVLESGMVLTVEPGIYLENEFGVRIEDMVIITDKGYENITKSSKELIII